MSVALIKKGTLENMVGAREPAVNVSKFEGHGLLNIGMSVPGMNPLALRRGPWRLLDRENWFQNFVIDVDVAQGFFGQALAYRCHCRHRVAHVAHFFGDQSFFVLSRRHNSELFGQIFASDHGEDAVELERPSAIDAEYPRVRMGTAQEFRIDCAGKIKIVGVDSFSRTLGHRIDLAERFTDYR